MQYMKALFLLAMASAAIGVGNGATRETFERGIRKLIATCKSGNVSSLPVHFPSLNPSLEVSPIKMKLDGLDLSLGTVTVWGLEDLSIEYLSADPDDWKMSIEVYVPRVSLRARYSLTGSKYVFLEWNDNGILTSTISGLRVKAIIQFGRFVGGPHKDMAGIHKYDLYYRANDIQAHLSDSGVLVQYKVKKLISDIVNSYLMKTLDNEDLKREIQTRLDAFIWSHTPNELIDVISEL